MTTNVVDKGFSLAQFYSKYGGLMSDAIKEKFFNRARRYNPHIDEQSILQYYNQRNFVEAFSQETTDEITGVEKLPRLCFSFATTDIRYGLRLLSDINTADYPSKKVVAFANFESSSDLGVFKKKILEYGIDGVVLELNTALTEASKGNYGTFVKDNVPSSGMIGDIAVVRTILQQFTFKNTSNGDAVFVLDDDMRLTTIERINGKFKEKRVNLKRFVSEYIGKADAVIGSYTGDAPLPSLSTLRTTLLDYVYARKLRKNSLVLSDIYKVPDYYYAFSDLGNVAIETPLPLLGDCSIDDVLGGRAVSRPLYRKGSLNAAPSRRGGNTLIFNRNLLLLPNVSIKISDVVARRGDSLWMLIAKRMGFRISASSFALNQSRIIGNFNLKKELQKEMADIIGYAAARSIERNGLDSRTKFNRDFQIAIRIRTIRFVVSYFRIIGLLQMLGDHKLDYLIKTDVIFRFIQKIREKSDISFVEAGFDGLRSDIGLYEKWNLISDIVSFLRDECGYSDVLLLGFGHEGAAFALGETTIKVFFQKEGLGFFKENVSLLKEVVGLPSNISFSDGGRYAFCSYSTILNVQPYEGGHAVELANLLYSLKRRGLTIRNLKKENMIVSKDKLYFIDLGKDIIPYSESAYDEAVERGYQAIEYASLSESDFRVIISRSHHLDAEALNFNLPVFAELARNRHKEQIHDPLVIELIEKHHPSSLLDYGAGKCKIANALSSGMDVFVFDVDLKTLRERANNNITIIDDIEKVYRQFDLINCNKVLCCVDENTCDCILDKIYRLLPDNGRLILSICDPFFDHIDKTESRTSGYHGKYKSSARFDKGTIYGKRKEWHRPFNYYERLLQRHGFEIESLQEDRGINVETLNFIGEEIIVDCIKKPKERLDDCSLLIKTNPMEANLIYESVRHIVTQLEKNSIFAERLLVADVSITDRARRYAPDDEKKLECEIQRLLCDGYIDRFIKVDASKDAHLYGKYFGLVAAGAHSVNGQGILATLKGFDECRTRYVFQADSDILFFNDGTESIGQALNNLKLKNAVTLSLSICKENVSALCVGGRVEVRNCFLDLDKIQKLLPLPNEVAEGKIKAAWHRSLDAKIKDYESIRLNSNHLFFIHPENDLKQRLNDLSVVRRAVENSFVPSSQVGSVNLKMDRLDWYSKTNSALVVFSRGRNTAPEKLLRLLDSLEHQQAVDFQLVYFDDASDREESSEYIRTISAYHPFWKNHMLFFANEQRVGSLGNFQRFYENVCLRSDAVIVNVDSDDALIGNGTLNFISKRFDEGADVTVGNCLRLDKPLKKYSVIAFKDSWKRNGDNIWLHPKCFRRYLCEFIQDNLKENGEYIECATDYAIMLPIVQHASHPEFIDRQIYLFDISNVNRCREGGYSAENRNRIMSLLLKRAKDSAARKTIAVIGDGSVSKDSGEYRLAFDLGTKLSDAGYNIQTGGLGGVMEAVFAGARASKRYIDGSTIAYIPSNNRIDANAYADVVLPTGLDLLRNGLVIDADAVIVIGGGAGTLSEIAMAWQKFKLIIALTSVEGWGKKLAGSKIDARIRYPFIPEDQIYPAATVSQALHILEEKLAFYIRRYNGIKWKKPKPIMFYR